MAVDFCIWVLEVDGLRVPPFDSHADGDGSLRTAGLDASEWQSWLIRIVNLQDEQRQRLQQGSKEDPLQTHKDLPKRLIAEAHHPAAAWQGNAAVGNRLATLWDQYGPLSNDRRSWEYKLTRQLHKAESGAKKRLYDELQPYASRIPTLTIHFVHYSQPLDYLVPPVSVIMTIQEGQPDAAEFRTRILDAAAELAARRSGQRRKQSKFIAAPVNVPGQAAPVYTILARKAVPPASPREKVHPVAENATKRPRNGCAVPRPNP